MTPATDTPVSPGARPPLTPPAFDTSVLSAARVYDYLLGGKDNYAADRAAAELILKQLPEVAASARANRAFLGRSVRYLAGEAGIRQFLDIGTGIPTAGNVHQVAQAVAPQSRVVYVDYDPVVLAHARALLVSSDAGATEYIDADLRDTGKILGGARELLDFTKPVALLLVAILHFVPDGDDPAGIIAAYRDALPPGSYLVLSHGTADFHADDPEAIAAARAEYGVSPTPLALRPKDAVERLLDGFDPVDPGLVPVPQWRPDTAADASLARIGVYGAVGRKK